VKTQDVYHHLPKTLSITVGSVKMAKLESEA